MDKYYYKEYAEHADLDHKLVHRVMQNFWLTVRQEVLSKPDFSYEGFVIHNFVSFKIMDNLPRKVARIGESRLPAYKKVMYLKVFRLLNEHKKKQAKIQKKKREKILNSDNKISRAISKYKEENKDKENVEKTKK